jgi:thiamine biosynthesis lipoprotein
MPTSARPLHHVLLPILIALGVLGRAPAAAGTRAELVMGAIATITTVDDRSEAVEAAFAELRAADAGMSLYRPDSALVRVNRHAAEHAEPVDDPLFACLARARALSAASDGAFDVTILPLLRAWGGYPDLAHLAATRADAVGWSGLVLDADARTVRFARAGMGIDLGGIAKGFALDRARAALAAAGVRRAVLDLSGNLALLGSGPADGWRVAVTDPSAPATTLGVLTLGPDQAVSTSGNYQRDFAVEGWRTPSHVYDPRTGRPVRRDLAVTVWAPDAATADALSTALLVLGPDDANDLLRREPEAGVLFVDGTGAARRFIVAGRAPQRFDPNDEPSTAVGIATDLTETHR